MRTRDDWAWIGWQIVLLPWTLIVLIVSVALDVEAQWFRRR